MVRDAHEIVGRLRVPQFVELREPLHRVHELPERDRVLAFGRGHDDRSVDRVALVEHERGNTVRAVAGDRVLMFLAHLRQGRFVGDRALDERRVEAGRADDAHVFFGNVHLHTVVEERVADRLVPAVELVVAELTPDQRADPHLPEAERPRSLPRVRACPRRG